MVNLALVLFYPTFIKLSEVVEKAVKKFPEDYVAKVDSASLKESELEEQLREASQLLGRAEATRNEINSSKTPDLSKSFQLASNAMVIGMYELAKKKIEEQLRKLREFDAESPKLFSELTSLNDSINTGLSQAGKAWNASTGTFDQTKITDMTGAQGINDNWDSRAERLEKERLNKFEKGIEGRQYCRVDIASGASVWMWVKDPSKVSQEDFKFNEEYKDYLAILMNPKENNIVDEYFSTMEEELRTGINAKTGEPLTDLEKAQRWSTVLSAISVVAIGAYYGKKGLTTEGNTVVKKDSGANRKVIEEITNPVLEAPRFGSGLKVDDIKPIKGKGSVYDIDPLTGKSPTKQTQIIIDEFPNVPKAHGFSDIIDNYAGLAEVTDLGNAKLYQIQGS